MVSLAGDAANVNVAAFTVTVVGLEVVLVR
jgi:hypothetical protein